MTSKEKVPPCAENGQEHYPDLVGIPLADEGRLTVTVERDVDGTPCCVVVRGGNDGEDMSLWLGGAEALTLSRALIAAADGVLEADAERARLGSARLSELLEEAARRGIGEHALAISQAAASGLLEENEPQIWSSVLTAREMGELAAQRLLRARRG